MTTEKALLTEPFPSNSHLNLCYFEIKKTYVDYVDPSHPSHCTFPSSDLQCSPPWRSQNPLRITLYPITGNSFILKQHVSYSVIFFRLDTRPKRYRDNSNGGFLDFSTLCSNNLQILTPNRHNRYDEYPRHFYRGVPPPPLPDVSPEQWSGN